MCYIIIDITTDTGKKHIDKKGNNTFFLDNLAEFTTVEEADNFAKTLSTYPEWWRVDSLTD